MKFVRFNNAEGMEVFLNPAHVVAVFCAASPEWSTVVFMDGSRLGVKGKPEDTATALSLVTA